MYTPCIIAALGGGEAGLGSNREESMVKLTRQYIEDHLVGTHTEESWARAVTEMVLRAAMAKLGDKAAEEITIDAQFRIRPVELEVTEPNGETVRRLCLRECVVVSPTGHEICFHKEAPK
jgi:hypothetical protein